MSENVSSGVVKPAKSTQLIGKALPGALSSAALVDLGSRLRQFGNLATLAALLSSHGRDLPLLTRKLVRTPLSIEQLQMLEAELSNQNILVSEPDQLTLAHYVAHRINVLRWHARRKSKNERALNFQIDVPSYIIFQARELTEIELIYPATTENLPSTQEADVALVMRCRQELSYLDTFAGFVLGKYDSESSRYQNGLNLVLRAILTSKTRITTPGVSINLPCSTKDFCTLIK